MKPRTCNILISICNDKGEHACYSLRPLPPDELGEGVAGFYLTKLNCDPAPVYAVIAQADGSVACNCPQYRFGSGCKHAKALTAAAVLPVGLLAVLRDRTQLLNRAEAEALRLAEAAVEERKVYEQDAESHASRLADLNEQIERLEAELEARKPKARRRVAKAA